MIGEPLIGPGHFGRRSCIALLRSILASDLRRVRSCSSDGSWGEARLRGRVPTENFWTRSSSSNRRDQDSNLSAASQAGRASGQIANGLEGHLRAAVFNRAPNVRQRRHAQHWGAGRRLSVVRAILDGEVDRHGSDSLPSRGHSSSPGCGRLPWMATRRVLANLTREADKEEGEHRAPCRRPRLDPGRVGRRRPVVNSALSGDSRITGVCSPIPAYCRNLFIAPLPLPADTAIMCKDAGNHVVRDAAQVCCWVCRPANPDCQRRRTRPHPSVHTAFLARATGGRRASLKFTNLSGLDLSGWCLAEADLSGGSCGIPI